MDVANGNSDLGVKMGSKNPPCGVPEGTEVIHQKQNAGWDKRPEKWKDTRGEQFSSAKNENGF